MPAAAQLVVRRTSPPSKQVTEWPRRASSKAQDRPITPAPATAIRRRDEGLEEALTVIDTACSRAKAPILASTARMTRFDTLSETLCLSQLRMLLNCETATI